MNLGLTGAVKVPFLDFGEIVDTKLRSHAEKRCHLIISWYYIDIFIISWYKISIFTICMNRLKPIRFSTPNEWFTPSNLHDPKFIICNLNPDPDWLGNSLPLFIQFNSRSTDVRIHLHKFWPTPWFCKRLSSHWSRAGLCRIDVWLSPCRIRPNTQENDCWLPQSDHIHRRYSFPD